MIGGQLLYLLTGGIGPVEGFPFENERCGEVHLVDVLRNLSRSAFDIRFAGGNIDRSLEGRTRRTRSHIHLYGDRNGVRSIGDGNRLGDLEQRTVVALVGQDHLIGALVARAGNLDFDHTGLRILRKLLFDRRLDEMDLFRIGSVGCIVNSLLRLAAGRGEEQEYRTEIFRSVFHNVQSYLSKIILRMITDSDPLR